MKKNQGPIKNGRGTAIVLAVCFVVAMAIVGTYTMKNYRDGVKDQLAQAEEEEKARVKKSKEKDDQSKNVNNTVIDNSTEVADAAKTAEAEQAAAAETQETTGNTAEVNFSEADQLLWPVSGNILLNFSMDKTVYFPTLDQYKYNPAVIISGEVDGDVIAAAGGVVSAIDVTAQTGTTVTIDMGNGYEAIYGQLKDVPVAVGDYVESGHAVGYLSEPTKYYSVEGCNLFFQMLKDGEPINPLEFLAS